MDPFMGYDLYQKTNKARAEGRLMRVLQDLYRKYGKTFQAKFLGVDVIYTSDPRNIQAINTTEFNNFLVSPLRRPANDDWVGEGIFVSDGHDWKQARKIVMPVFAREHVTDLSGFKVHLDRMLQLIPRAGETVDLRPLFRRLVCWISLSSLYLPQPESSSNTPVVTKKSNGFIRCWYAVLGLIDRVSLWRIPRHTTP